MSLCFGYLTRSLLQIHEPSFQWCPKPYGLTGANVLAENRLFATLDPTTRRVQFDRVSEPQKVKLEAQKREDVVCISALNGDRLDEFCSAVQEKLKDFMVWVEALVPFEKGDLLSNIHQVGMVERMVSNPIVCKVIDTNGADVCIMAQLLV